MSNTATCPICGTADELVRVFVRDAYYVHGIGTCPIQDTYHVLCQSCAEEHGCNAYEGVPRSELWSIFFGDCTPSRFLRESDQPTVEEAVEDYLSDIGRLAQLPAGDEPTEEEMETLRRAFVGYIAAAVEREVERVFGYADVTINVRTASVLVDGWPSAVRYRVTPMLSVLARFEDGHGVTERGDAEVCAALERDGALIG